MIKMKMDYYPEYTEYVNNVAKVEAEIAGKTVKEILLDLDDERILIYFDDDSAIECSSTEVLNYRYGGITF